MHVRVLAASGFRNLQNFFLQPHPRFNVLHGDNGQGKTNILEMIYLLATLRSFRTSRIEEMVQFGCDTATAQSLVERQGVERRLTVDLGIGAGRHRRKEALVDGKPARASEYFGGMNVVLFAPDDLQLPKGPPAQRRRFLDRAVWNTCPSYLREAQTFERVLRSRNALLRAEERPADFDALLDIYDDQLARAGSWLVARRQHYLGLLAPLVEQAFERVSRSGLRMAVRYRRSGGHLSGQEQDPGGPRGLDQAASQAAEVLLSALCRDRRRDVQRGYTHSGPHTDELELELEGRPAAIHASQGQIRALVLALKIAEIRQLTQALSDTPVLLLDDVSSELDPSRNAYLFEFLREIPCQTFITTTSPTHIKLPVAEERQDHRICGGSLDVSAENVV